MEEEQVVLVDEQDREVGTLGKMEAHREGRLHRAVSVILFNAQKKMLLQKRAADKYHSAGLWTNACCSHPRPGEDVLQAAERRLYEEMGIRCKLQKVFEFTYQAQLDKGLSENEFDHVFAGISNDVPLPDPNEVSEYRYESVAEIEKQLREQPGQFTAWFKLLFDRIRVPGSNS